MLGAKVNFSLQYTLAMTHTLSIRVNYFGRLLQEKFKNGDSFMFDGLNRTLKSVELKFGSHVHHGTFPMVLFLLKTLGKKCTYLENLHVKTHLDFVRPEHYYCLENCSSNLKKLTVQKFCDAEIFFGVFSKKISLIIEEVTPQDLKSFAFVTICEDLKKLRKVEFKINPTKDFWQTDIFEKNLQGTEVVVSTKHGLVKPLTFGQTSMFRPM